MKEFWQVQKEVYESAAGWMFWSWKTDAAAPWKVFVTSTLLDTYSKVDSPLLYLQVLQGISRSRLDRSSSPTKRQPSRLCVPPALQDSLGVVEQNLGEFNLNYTPGLSVTHFVSLIAQPTTRMMRDLS